jgi:ParB/RepB/Spo0J family partition protein
MTKRPNIKEIGLGMMKEGSDPRQDHPVRHLAASEGFLYIPIAQLRPNPDQPRQHFDAAALEDLTASVKEKGVLQPVLARKDPEGDGYFLIAGERRWRAATAAGLTEIPSLIRGEADALEVALIENLQRENLNALEEAEVLFKLKKARDFTDEQLGKIIGKSRTSVTESLALINLPQDIKAECRALDTASKIQLLQVFRAGSEEKMRAAWKALKTGEIRTTRGLRALAKPNGKGRPKHYRFVHRPRGQSFRVQVTFTKAEATAEEIKAALQDALNNVP